MEMICVNSSNVVSVGYEKNKLYVEYKRGEYVYHNVPESVYQGLLKAESKGKYMCAEVKGKYDYERIG
jgi:hypothetical protein